MSLASQLHWPPLDFERLHQFAFDPEFRARVPFLYGDHWYVGGQNTVVAPDLAAWDFWRFGRWRGPAPLRTVPSDLAVSGTTLVENPAGYPLATAESGIGLTASAGVLYPGQFQAASREWRLYDTVTGTLQAGSDPVSGIDPGAWTLPDMPAGSYALWVRFTDIEQNLFTPEQYKALTGISLSAEYLYTEEGRTYWWDWRRNLGRTPTDPANPFYASRRDLVVAGQTLDQPEWAIYLQAGGSMSGEWSLLRLQIGGGSWSCLAAASPGPALYRKAVSSALSDEMEPVLFDISARSVSAATILRDGRLLVAGNSAGRSGSMLALWQFDGEAWTLLGLNPNLSNGICECSLADHTCGSIVEAEDGTIYVLTKCSLHRYTPSGAALQDRLADYPAATGGHPGGQCLREFGGALWWVTENFGGSGRNPVTNTTQFYNTLRTLAADGKLGIGVGTVCHGPNALTVHRGALTGVVQDLPFSAEAARGRIGTIHGAAWVPDGPDWPTGLALLQGVESVRGQLICGGVESETVPETGKSSELPLAAVLSGPGAQGDGGLQFARFPLRVERMTRVLRDGHEELLVLGKETDDPEADPDALPYTLVNLPFRYNNTPWQHFCLNWDGESEFRIDLGFLPSSVKAEAAPLYLRYVATDDGPGQWIPSATQPDTVYLRRQLTEDHLEYVLVGDPPYDFGAYDKICFTVDGSGNNGDDWNTGPAEPEETWTNGQEVLDHMPDGTKITVLKVPLQQDWWTLQIDDVESDQPLAHVLRDWPSVWLCLDKNAADNDYEAYNLPVRRINQNGCLTLPRTMTPADDEMIRVLYLWPPLLDSQPYEVSQFSIQRRE